MTLRFQGWIMRAHILQPQTYRTKEHNLPTIDQIKLNPSRHECNKEKEVQRYQLALFPMDPTYYSDIESQIELKHAAWTFAHWNEMGEDSQSETPSLSRVFEDDCLIFETTRKPRLEGEFSGFTTDDQFNGNYCQVVGHLQQLDLGDCMMSFHILEPAVHPSEIRDPIDDFNKGEDDW